MSLLDHLVFKLSFTKIGAHESEAYLQGWLQIHHQRIESPH